MAAAGLLGFKARAGQRRRSEGKTGEAMAGHMGLCRMAAARTHVECADGS